MIYLIEFPSKINKNPVYFVSKESLMPRLGELSAEKGADTDQRVLEAYQMQCVAEAQEGKNRVCTCITLRDASSFFIYLFVYLLIYFILPS